jgi:putative inorganic carbon (hco3(-)) transporter
MTRLQEATAPKDRRTMRGLVLFIIFFGLLSLVFKRPFIGILMWFWISLLNPHRYVYGFATGLSYALILALVTLGSWLFLHPEEPKFPPRDRMTFLIVALMVWISISSLTGVGPSDDIINFWGDAEKMLLMTLVAYTMTNTRERFDQLILICVLSIAYFGFAGGIFSILRGGSARIFGPPSSMIADNNDLGVALAMILPLLFYFHSRYTQPNYRWPLRAFIALVVIGALFTYSRGALLGLAAMGGVLWLRTPHKAVTGIAIVIAIVGMLQLAPSQWLDRMQTVQTYEQDKAAESRLWLWQVSWIVAKKYPITGAGFHWGWNWNWVNFQIEGSGLRPLVRPRAPHSIWFEMVSTHGFVGLALFVGFMVASAADAQWLIRRTRGSPELAWANNFGRMFQAGLVGFAVGGSFVSLDLYDGFYAMAILGASARRIVAAELAARPRTVETPLAGMLPAAAASQVRLGQPLART